MKIPSILVVKLQFPGSARIFFPFMGYNKVITICAQIYKITREYKDRYKTRKSNYDRETAFPLWWRSFLDIFRDINEKLL